MTGMGTLQAVIAFAPVIEKAWQRRLGQHYLLDRDPVGLVPPLGNRDGLSGFHGSKYYAGYSSGSALLSESCIHGLAGVERDLLLSRKVQKRFIIIDGCHLRLGIIDRHRYIIICTRITPCICCA